MRQALLEVRAVPLRLLCLFLETAVRLEQALSVGDDGSLKDDLQGYGKVDDMVSVVVETDVIVDVSTPAIKALCDGLRNTGVTKLNMGDVGLTPMGLTTLASVITDMPALSKVNLSTNKCFGSKDQFSRGDNCLHDIDKDQTGWTAFCEALPSTKIEKLVLSDIGMGPVGLTTLAKFIPDSPTLSKVNLGGNAAITVADIEALHQLHSNVKFKT